MDSELLYSLEDAMFNEKDSDDYGPVVERSGSPSTATTSTASPADPGNPCRGPAPEIGCGHDGGVRARRRRHPRRRRDRHDQGAARGRHPSRCRRRHLDRRDQRRAGRRRPDARRRSTRLLHAWTSPEANAVYGDSLVAQVAPAREDQDAPQFAGAAAAHPRAVARRGHPVRGPRRAAAGGRGEHRAGRGARVRLGTADPRRPRVGLGAGAPAADPHRRRALHRRRRGELDPDRPGARRGRPDDLRPAGGAHRDAAGRADLGRRTPRGSRSRSHAGTGSRATSRRCPKASRCTCSERRRARRRRRADGIPQDGDRAPPHRSGLRGQQGVPSRPRCLPRRPAPAPATNRCEASSMRPPPSG